MEGTQICRKCAKCGKVVTTDQPRYNHDGIYTHVSCAPDPVTQNAEVRGTCSKCGKAVTTAQARVKDESGSYSHESCALGLHPVGQLMFFVTNRTWGHRKDWYVPAVVVEHNLAPDAPSYRLEIDYEHSSNPECSNPDLPEMMLQADPNDDTLRWDGEGLDIPTRSECGAMAHAEHGPRGRFNRRNKPPAQNGPLILRSPGTPQEPPKGAPCAPEGENNPVRPVGATASQAEGGGLRIIS